MDGRGVKNMINDLLLIRNTKFSEDNWKKSHLRFLYPVKLSFKTEGEIKKFSDNVSPKLKKFMSTTYVL